eukprot:gene3930-3844_t
MNKLCYKTIFSKRLGALVAVGEHAASQGKANGLFSGAGLDKGCSRAAVCYIGALTLSFALVSMAWAAPANTALPTGGQVAQGAAAISQSGANMAIHQSTARAVVNWQNFDIGKDAKVNIVQPNAQAVLLNRVTGAAPSQIFGQMTANGQVVLVNPNGVTFGKDGSVSAAGLTASTLNTTDADFMAGRKHYTRDGATGQVLNQGTLTSAPGGYVALLGASVSNEGKIVAPQGKVALGAAETITMPLYGSSRIKLELTPSAINAAVANQKGGSIVTEGGQVYMQAAAVGSAMASVMQSGGIDTTGAQGGAVYLLADGGRIQVDGSITANSTSAGHKGGDIILGRDEVTGVLAKSTDVSGARLESKGGFVETSGEFLKVDGIQVKAKEWLLDPNDIVIGSTATTGGSLSAAQAANGVSQILASDVSNALIAGTNVIIATSALAPGGNGDITVDTAVSNTADGNTLTLNAGRNVVLNNSITASNISLNAATGSVSGAGALTTTGLLTLNSATDGTLSGNISGAGGLTKTGAGTMTLTGANTFTAGAGTQILTGTNLYTGTTTISGGTLQVGDGNGTGTLGSGKVTLANGANLNYKRNVSTTIANAIEGSGNVNADITAGGLIVDLSADAKINIGGADAGSATLKDRILGLSTAELNLITAGNLVIGDASNSGGITVSAATATNATTGNVTLQTGGNIEVNAALTLGTQKLSLQAGGNVTQVPGAAIKAAELQLKGLTATANFTLGEKTNAVGKLAAAASKVVFANASALEIGEVNLLGLTSGITATAGASITTQTGNLTITKDISNIGSGDVVLGAGVEKLVVMFREKVAMAFTSGAHVNHTYGDAKTKDNGSSKSALWTEYATTLASGQVAQVVMSKANLTKVTASKTYDGLQTVKAVEVTAIEGVNGESFTAASGTAAISGKNVAGAKTVTDLTGLSLTSGNGGDTGNYNLNSGLPAQGAATNNVDIGKATLALSLADQTKVYDGKLDAAIKAGDITATGVIVGGNTEKVSLKAVTGAYNNKNVANANSASATVSASDVNTGTAANGLDLGNYTLSDTSATQTVTNSNSNITKATLALGLADQTKVYDGKLDAAIKAANGLDLGNYTLSDTSATQTVTNSKSNITKATLALSLADQTKVYDGTLDAAIAAAQVSAKGVTVNGQTESASFNAVSGSYNSKNVADAQTVSTTTKVYDGTVDAVIAAGQIRASGVNVSGQTESALFKALSGSYDSKNVVGAAAVRATVRASDVASTANNLDLNNYTLSNTNATQVATGIGKITQANLTLTANSDSSKVYNEQSVSGFAITSGSLKGTDTAALDLAAITAGGKRTDAGTTATTVNDSDYKNGNYAISKVDGTFFIAQKEVALAAAKTYDGNKTLTGTQLRITTGVGAETLGYNSASINNKDVKDNNTNYVDAVVLTDGTGKASNYKFTAARSANNTVALTQANLTLTANSDSSKLYNGAEQSVSGYAITSGSLKGTDTAALDLAAITAGGKRTDAGTTATTVNDSDYTNGNYAISKVDGVLYVAQKEVALAAAKTYDGGKTLTGTQLRITTGVGAETLGYNSASINNKDVKDNNTNYVDAVVLTDGTGKASNYKFTAARSANNTVALTQAHLKVTLADQTKTYDGTTAATLVPSAFTVKGVTVAGQTETASVNQTVALYNDKNVLGASSVTADLAAGNFAAATGTDLNNYNLPTSVIGKGKITPKEAAVTGTATTVQANGTQQIQAPATKSGFVSGEEVTVSGLATGLIAGAYNSNLSAAAANAATVLSNYKIAYTNAALRITPAIVTNSTV